MSAPQRELVETATLIAREAGKLLMADLPLGRRDEALAEGITIEDKGDGELVSRVDRASEALIRKLVAERYPNHVVLGEEDGEVRPEAAPDELGFMRWVVDPLDGTTNYLHGHPFFAVSIAIERVDDSGARSLEAAVVHAPYFSETYFAARGEGAFLNTWNLPIRTSDTRELDRAVLATGFAYDRERYPNYDNFLRLIERARGMRRCGAAALDLAFVACGRYDGFWELGLRPWDVAAGALLVREAGGEVTSFSGDDKWLTTGNVVAANSHLAGAIRDHLDPAAHLSIAGR